ncbi:mannose-1-phosphate guanylyltransferase [Clostridium celatum]|uniref:mannose-1-phosphate guanylyltransferase n=1 Tax=Clostridium celatum TaxID=36834 RepID=UPI002901296F|nr:mannose-1-phosphate guanylyltransferase [Clostridium celatum]MDU2265750.1 mannose-1-phosphate guanylyltransferase [Clostridium celatum]MDU3722176.1 mannose-1-phosphate guanylyltransferase [Clostridium celatum]MDU6294637.1 mannose-1-phosphate guanylyltransferase [Clostridium celatum]
MLTAVIMAGGKGTRFWPLSTEDKPKQFLNLIGNETMIQMTVNRIKSIIPLERIFICTGEKYVNLVKEQLPDIKESNIIVEPEGRNTAPCIALSAMIIKRYYNDATMVVLPSDHLINNEEKFRNILLKGNEFLKEEKNHDSILTLGITPNRAETGYGYIKCGEAISEDIVRVDEFVEKPNLDKANEYLKLKNYLWNSGMFIWKTEAILNKIKEFIPYTYEALNNLDYVKEEDVQKLINERYKYTDEISIDFAVLEKCKEIYVIPSDIGWDDVGSWEAVERYREKDSNGNISNSNFINIDSKDNMIINNMKKVVMIGIKDILAIELEDSIFIVNKDHINNIKEYKGII